MRFACLTLVVALFLPAVATSQQQADGCTATNWLTVPLRQGGHVVEIALETAYPGASMALSQGVFTSAEGIRVAYRGPQDTGPMERLQTATIGDQFYYPYPLAFDLEARKAAFVDPGRLRNDALFRAIWFSDRAAARASLAQVVYAGRTQRATFQMTRKYCVHAQLQAALDEIAAQGPGIDRFFESVGGSFNWRKIAGTNRLSAHSFGISVDFNTELGGYWRWSGAKPGQAARYDNKYPAELVQAMERYGFIWGGKWHHFDGMHFEYRPELILMARLTGGG